MAAEPSPVVFQLNSLAGRGAVGGAHLASVLQPRFAFVRVFGYKVRVFPVTFFKSRALSDVSGRKPSLNWRSRETFGLFLKPS